MIGSRGGEEKVKGTAWQEEQGDRAQALLVSHGDLTRSSGANQLSKQAGRTDGGG